MHLHRSSTECLGWSRAPWDLSKMIQEDSLSCLETAETRNIRISKVLKVEKNKETQHSNKWLKGFATDFHQEFHQVPPGSTKSPCGLQEDGASSKHKGALSGGDRRLKPKGRSCRGMFPAKVRPGLCQSEGHGKSRFTEFTSKVGWVERCHCRAAAPQKLWHWCRKGLQLGYTIDIQWTAANFAILVKIGISRVNSGDVFHILFPEYPWITSICSQTRAERLGRSSFLMGSGIIFSSRSNASGASSRRR